MLLCRATVLTGRKLMPPEGAAVPGSVQFNMQHNCAAETAGVSPRL